MTTIVPITLNCPACGKEFQSSVVGSCGYASKRTDFRPNYWGMNPVEYFYHLCPNCGFCSNETFFKSRIEDLSLLASLKRLGVLENPTVSEKLERACICNEMIDENASTPMTNWMKSNMWLYAFHWASGKEEEEKYGKKTLKFLVGALKDGSAEEEKVPFVQYLIGEINRRIGNVKKAMQYFNLVIDSKDEKLSALARQQRDDPKDTLD